MPERPADREQVFRILRSRKEEARERFGAELVGVVGSMARGDAKPDSDVDVILRLRKRITLFGLVDLQDFLAKDLGRSVDLVLSEDMRPERRAYIERDLVRL
jgi:predicted nucleotidyltransferase